MFIYSDLQLRYKIICFCYGCDMNVAQACGQGEWGEKERGKNIEEKKNNFKKKLRSWIWATP